jgi:hypothetical protein
MANQQDKKSGMGPKRGDDQRGKGQQQQGGGQSGSQQQGGGQGGRQQQGGQSDRDQGRGGQGGGNQR